MDLFTSFRAQELGQARLFPLQSPVVNGCLVCRAHLYFFFSHCVVSIDLAFEISPCLTSQEVMKQERWLALLREILQEEDLGRL